MNNFLQHDKFKAKHKGTVKSLNLNVFRDVFEKDWEKNCLKTFCLWVMTNQLMTNQPRYSLRATFMQDFCWTRCFLPSFTSLHNNLLVKIRYLRWTKIIHEWVEKNIATCAVHGCLLRTFLRYSVLHWNIQIYTI